MEPTPEIENRQAERVRFVSMARKMALLSLAVAIIAVAVVAHFDPDPSIHLLIATAILAGGTVLLGTILMSLIFFSARGGHDAEAARPPSESDSQ